MAKNGTAYYISAFNTSNSEVSIVPEGVKLDFPVQTCGNNLNSGKPCSVFRIPEDGNYFITYRINFTEKCPVISEVILNGNSSLIGLRYSPKNPASHFAAEGIHWFNACDELQLMLYGEAEAVLAGNSSFNIIGLP